MNPEVSETIKAFFGTLGFLFVLLPIFLIGIPYKIVSHPVHALLFDLGAYRYFGLVPIVAGVVIYFWCAHSFVFFGKGTPIFTVPTKKLLVTGLYRFVRNPMYIAGLLVLAGEVLLFQSRDLLIYLLVMFGFFNVIIFAVEEPYLSNKFGDTYKQYCKSVRRWIPRLKPYRGNGP